MRLDVVASAFEAAGGSGQVSTVANSSIAAALAANGVSEQRPELEVPAVQAIGNPPTSGYSNDPVNTATGNFVENEEDLRFEGGVGLLGWARSYSSLSGKVGGHGPGWASFDGAGLRVSDEGATWTQVDGREVVFPRMGDGFDRAEHENFWLEATGEGFVVSNNAGARWEFSSDGCPTLFTVGEGATIFFDHEGGRLVRVRHVRGREIGVEWEGDLIRAVAGDDGRRVEYSYEGGRLVAASGPAGTRRYEWGEQGLVTAVIDADGVVEARNTYDSQGRVSTQLSPFGRLTRFAYLPGRVTSVSDEDGSRANTWVADERGRVVAITDTDGNTTRLSWDRWGNQVMTVDGEGGRTVREFDSRGRLVAEMTPSGALTRLSYDEADRLVSRVALEEGREVSRTSLSYAGAQCQPCEIVDGEGGVTRMEWDGGLLLRATDATGVSVSFEYDSHGDLVASRDAAGNVTRVERDGAGRVVRTIMPSGATTCYEWDEAGQLRARVDPDGARWTYEYSPGGRLQTIVNPLGARTALEFGEGGELSATVDALGRRVEQTFDDLGNVSRVRLPDGATWEFTHDAASRLRQSVDPTGGVWTRHYDQVGRLSGVVDPTGARTTAVREGAGRQVRVGDAHSSAVVRMDCWGRTIATIGSDGTQTSTTYDRAGRPVEFVDAAGGRTRVERDAAGRPVRVRKPGGSSVRYDYDQCGRLAGVTNELGFRTALVYDEDSRVVEEVWPTRERAWTRYDVCGRVTARHTPGVGTYRWVYDKAGRVVEAKDPHVGVRRLRYDQADQLVAVTGGTGGVSSYEYDPNGRAVRVTDPMGGVTLRTFDAMDRCTSVTDPLGNTSRAVYDAAGRLVRNTDPDGHQIDIDYDQTGYATTITLDGALVQRSTRDAVARTRTIEDFCDPARPVTHVLSYDPRGLLLRHDKGAASTSWTWDADGNVTSRTTPNGDHATYQLDAAGQVVGVEQEGLPALAMRRDQVGRLIEAMTDQLTHQWSYADGFVTSHHTTSPQASHTTRMEYTPQGLLQALDRDGSRTEYAYDDAAQLVRASGPSGTNTWTFDAGGRMTDEHVDGAEWTRTFDAAGRMLTAKSKDKSITYTYDRSGRRTGEEHSDGKRTRIEWTGLWRPSAFTRHQDGAQVRTTTLVDALGQLARVDDQDIYYDTLTGTPAQVGDQSVLTVGPMTAAADGWMDPTWRPGRDTSPTDPYLAPHAQAHFGEPLALGAAGAIRVAGMEWLDARVMDPSSRSFLSPDPLPPVTGAAWAANPYSYAGNNPLNLIDPSGLRPITTQELDDYRKANSPKWGTALAIVAGVALAFVPGAQGFAAAIIAGAVLGGGASIIDQVCSGYPINWGQVGKDTLFGAAGGAAGWGIGKGLQWAAKTPAGQAVTKWVGNQVNRIPGVQAVKDLLARRGTSEVAEQGADDALNAVASPAKARPTPEPPMPSTTYEGAVAEVRTTSSAARLPQDIEVSPDAPPAMETDRPISRSASQNAWAQRRLDYLRSIGADNIRVNQQMVDVTGRRVGINRPDIGYTLGGRRFAEEIDTSTSTRGPAHADRILANDPHTTVYLWIVD
ncbi:hypothetical protein I6B53_10690 [Schaalia sp. 19OD2882]|uniref:DUF6531 domain-containing protein n=1 Tax=Schaalia sp. 19OD2882 TaxID=2794089 RepID=UPI001C1EF691|nr:DUF6531 domain-containing protein [Schaalia sp. 19OD2882]QWW19524.1 hypothetical protein I6B53_10690 [Schaalia sp. 19OD2882]